MPLGNRAARDRREEERPGPEDAGPSNNGRRRSRDEEEEGRNVRAKLEADSNELDRLLVSTLLLSSTSTLICLLGRASSVRSKDSRSSRAQYQERAIAHHIGVREGRGHRSH